MYEPVAVLAAGDRHAVPVLLIAGRALLDNAVYYFEALRYVLLWRIPRSPKFSGTVGLDPTVPTAIAVPLF